MKLLTLVLFILAATSVAAYDLADYPEPFVQDGKYNAQLIVGDAAPSGDVLAALEIASNLKLFAPDDRIIAVLASEADISGNLILIGNGCNNELVMDYLDEEDCNLGLSEGLSFIKGVDVGDSVVLIIAGRTTTDTRKAAVALVQNQDDLENDEVEVIGDLENPEITEPGLRGLFPETEDEPELVVSCTTHDDCAENEKCGILTGCETLECPEGTEAIDHRCTKIIEPEPEPEPEFIVEAEPTPEPEPELGFFGKILAWFANLF